ncbi:MAG: alpha/beta fold hydrolase [Solirubrobacterales bacterium]
MTPQFTTFEGHKLAYETYGRGPRNVLLIHGLLMNRRMQEPLAKALAEQGNHTITVDLAGHGKSDAPLERWGIPRYARALDAMLEELDVEDAVVIGTSLGANIGLQLAAEHSARVRGIVAEMPALEHAMIGGPIFFSPFAAAAAWAEPVAQVISHTARLIPDVPLPFSANIVVDLIKRDPNTTLEILKGLYYGPIAPAIEVRKQIEQTALVIGHRYDPIHPIQDAEELAADLPNSRFIEASSIAELRVNPERLTNELIDFVDQCFKPRVVDIDKPTKNSRKTGSRKTST